MVCRSALLAVLLLLALPNPVLGSCNVAIIGAGLGGSAAAYYLRERQPVCHIEVFEREALGGRVQEFKHNGQMFELGASIIHGWNQYVMSAAKDLGLTTVPADDSGTAGFSIWDGSKFVFKQEDGIAGSIAAMLRYGLAPLKYAKLSMEAGRKFGGIYSIQQQGSRCYRSPDELLQALGLLDLTIMSVDTYAKSQLTWLYCYGAERFIDELAGAVNRVNYNQHNSQINAFAGMVSYLPAAVPELYFIKEGNQQLAVKLLNASHPQSLHLAVQVTQVEQQQDGTWAVHTTPAAAAAAHAVPQGVEAEEAASRQGTAHGPFTAVILAAPLKGSGISIRAPPLPPLPPRDYQTTVTSFIQGTLNPAYFGVDVLPEGDIFVTTDAATPFSVLAYKGPPGKSQPRTTSNSGKQATSSDQQRSGCNHGRSGGASSSSSSNSESGSSSSSSGMEEGKKGQEDWDSADSSTKVTDSSSNSCGSSSRSSNSHSSSSSSQSSGSGDGGRGDENSSNGTREASPLWKVFSTAPLSNEDLDQMFVDYTLLHNKTWRAYPRYHPPESLDPFLLAPGLVYNNALESSASAMEVALVAAMNSVLLVTEGDSCYSEGQQQQQQQEEEEEEEVVVAGRVADGGKQGADVAVT